MAALSDDLCKSLALRYNITELIRGMKYYVRVSALNTLGYGEPADYEDAVPITSPDAPGFPTTIAQLGEETTGETTNSPFCEYWPLNGNKLIFL